MSYMLVLGSYCEGAVSSWRRTSSWVQVQVFCLFVCFVLVFFPSMSVFCVHCPFFFFFFFLWLFFYMQQPHSFSFGISIYCSFRIMI